MAHYKARMRRTHQRVRPISHIFQQTYSRKSRNRTRCPPVAHINPQQAAATPGRRAQTSLLWVVSARPTDQSPTGALSVPSRPLPSQHRRSPPLSTQRRDPLERAVQTPPRLLARRRARPVVGGANWSESRAGHRWRAEMHPAAQPDGAALGGFRCASADCREAGRGPPRGRLRGRRAIVPGRRRLGGPRPARSSGLSRLGIVVFTRYSVRARRPGLRGALTARAGPALASLAPDSDGGSPCP